MKNIKIVIIILIVITMFISILLVTTLNNKKNQYNTNINVIADNDNVISNNNLEYESNLNDSLKTVSILDNRNKYYVIQEIVKTYSNNNFIINKVYFLKKTTNIDVFWIDAIIGDNSTELIIVTDSLNNSYLILTKNDMENEKYNIDNLSNINIEKIEQTEGNKFEYKNISDNIYVQDLLRNYIKKTLYKEELGYEILNSEYKESRFGGIEKYKKNIDKNRKELILYDGKNLKQYGEFSDFEEWELYIATTKLLEVDKYLIKKRDGYTEYTVIDTYGNYYIFEEIAPMQYTVILDTYTLDLPEFLEKYNKADEELKVKMNINRFFESLKAEDYEYSYNKLETHFKKQYFVGLEEFKTYMKNNFVYDQDIEYYEFSDLDEYYTYKINMKKDENILSRIITMKLGENTDFTISFNM